MLYLIRRVRRPLAVINRRLLATALPLLLVVSLTTPLTVSCQRKSSGGDHGIAELSALVESNQGRPAPADMAVALGDPESARREVARLAEADDADAVYIAAQAAELTGKTDEAIKLYRKIYYELAATRASVQAEQRLAALGAAVKDHPGTLDEERARADALLESKQFNEAAQAYTNLLTRFPEAAGNDAIQLRLGKSLLGARQT